MHISDAQYHILRNEYGLEPIHILHLEYLADFLDSDKIPPPQFSMRTFVALPDGLSNDEYNRASMPAETMALVHEHCGTCACAAGHGPLAGMPAEPDETWDDYTRRVFGIWQSTYGATYRAWVFLFDSQWRGANNTAIGSAARICWFLQHDVPDNYTSMIYEHVESPWITDEVQARINEKAKEYA